jgi:two-component system response regulator YesN
VWRAGASIDITRFYLGSTIDDLVAMVGEREPLDPDNLRELADTFRDRIRQARSALDLTSIFEEAVETLCKTLAAPTRARKDLRLERARKLVIASFRDRIRLADVAKATGLSTGHFSKLFKKHVGVGFAQYVHRLRMERARDLLRTTPLPVEQVVRETGFRSYLYFFEAFRKEHGMTPRAYRRRFAKIHA